MVNEKWTRGPWFIGKYGKVKGDGMTDCSFESICVSGMTLSSGDEAEANSSLISAAPELYEALKACTEGEFACTDKDAVAMAESAMAKARGEL